MNKVEKKETAPWAGLIPKIEAMISIPRLEIPRSRRGREAP